MSGWREVTSQFHDNLMEVMAPFQNQILKTSTIKRIIAGYQAFEGKEQWIYPSDHCINHTNKGACYCAETEEAIFMKIRRGMYKVRSGTSPLAK
jgi:hypothetical protein